MSSDPLYSANITAGALRLRESRLLAGMVLEQQVRLGDLVDLAVEDNLLQLPNPSSTRRVARLLSQRREARVPSPLSRRAASIRCCLAWYQSMS